MIYCSVNIGRAPRSYQGGGSPWYCIPVKVSESGCTFDYFILYYATMMGGGLGPMPYYYNYDLSIVTFAVCHDFIFAQSSNYYLHLLCDVVTCLCPFGI